MSLDVYLSNTAVTVAIDLVDNAGSPITANSVDYRVVNQDGVEVVPTTALTGFVSGDPQAAVTVPANINQIVAPNTREVRTIHLTCVTDNFTVSISRTYGLELQEPLKTGVNSFQSYAQAQLTAMDVPNIPGWNAASESERVAALIEAREHLIQLNYVVANTDRNQSSLFFGNASLWGFEGDISDLKEADYETLPEAMKRALRKAQIVEADYILGGDPEALRRAQGLVEERIGESSQKWTFRKGLTLPVCRRAMSYLGSWVNLSRRIGRST